MNDNEKLSPGYIIIFGAFIIISAIFYMILDKMILSILIGGLIVGVVTGVIYGVLFIWKKTDKQIIKKYSIIIVLPILLIIIVCRIPSAISPELTQKQVEQLVINELTPQLEKIKKELSVEDVSVEFHIEKYKYKKPKFFTKGVISMEVFAYYVSKEFKELDSGIYNNETCKKYSCVSPLDYSIIKIDKYKVDIQRRAYYTDIAYKDSYGNSYTFDTNHIYKNGQRVYGISAEYDSKAIDEAYQPEYSKCSWCGGDGRTHDWVDSGNRCSKCGGDGRIENNY